MKSHTFIIVSMLLLAIGGAWTNASAEVNVNKASAAELAQALKNVGLAKAAAIVEYRSMHGDFKSVDELAGVHGIGKATVEMNRDQIILSDPHPGANPGANPGMNPGVDPGVNPGAGNSRVSNVADSKPGAPETPESPELGKR